MIGRSLLALALLLFGASAADAQTFGVKKKIPRPDQYGTVVMNNASGRSGIAPVVYNHWLHRARYTCRLCHVDLGFAMSAGATGVTEADNKAGMYCGACHNGKEAFGPVRTPQTLTGPEVTNCDLCHSLGKKVAFERSFADFVKDLPKSRFGNRVDWLKAEQAGQVKLVDALEGITVKRKPLKIPVDEGVKAREFAMPEIIFSHEKHAVWSGCELCHPDLFEVKQGATKYTMQDIFEGKFCGACHGKVAFSEMDCQLCHVKEVQ
jgi:c(7)-type cytochrome triheme protein